MFAQLTIVLDEKEEVVTVPETAIAYSIQGNTVFVIEETEENLRVQPRVVRTGTVRDGRIAVIEGLSLGERVVTVGQNKLYRGAPVVVDESLQL